MEISSLAPNATIARDALEISSLALNGRRISIVRKPDAMEISPLAPNATIAPGNQLSCSQRAQNFHCWQVESTVSDFQRSPSAAIALETLGISSLAPNAAITQCSHQPGKTRRGPIKENLIRNPKIF